MSRWFRFYDDVLNDPKVQALSPEIFKFWVNFLCLFSQSKEKLPEDGLHFMLRTSEKKANAAIAELQRRGLIDVSEQGLEPHNWAGRQYKSDVSNDRVRRYRERHRNAECNVTPAVTVTSPDIQRTEDRGEKEKEGGASAKNFAFVGRVIRLKESDYEQWAKRYSHIPDLLAELSLADDYYSESPPKDGKWFFPVSSWLNRANKAAIEAAKPENDPLYGVDTRPMSAEEQAEANRLMELSFARANREREEWRRISSPDQ